MNIIENDILKFSSFRINELCSVYPSLEKYREHVFVCSMHYPNIVMHVDIIKEIILKQVKCDKTVILDVSLEDVQISQYKTIHEIVDDIDSHFLVLTGSLKGEEYYHSLKKQNNFKDNFTIISYHSWENFMKDRHQDDKFKKLSAYDVRSRKKSFLCYNRVPRFHRVMMYAYASRHGWINNSYFSLELVDSLDYHKFSSMDISDTEIYYPYMKSWIQDEIQKNNFPLRINLNDDDNNRLILRDDDLLHFHNTCLSIVTETFFFYPKEGKDSYLTVNIGNESSSGFLSEKTFKPIIAKHPFIMVGRPGFLSLLKNCGYKTFHPFIDETYDIIEDDYERMNHINNEIVRLNNFTEKEWLTWQEGVKNIVEYNHTHFYSEGRDYSYTPWNEGWIK